MPGLPVREEGGQAASAAASRAEAGNGIVSHQGCDRDHEDLADVNWSAPGLATWHWHLAPGTWHRMHIGRRLGGPGFVCGVEISKYVCRYVCMRMYVRDYVCTCSHPRRIHGA